MAQTRKPISAIIELPCKQAIFVTFPILVNILSSCFLSLLVVVSQSLQQSSISLSNAQWFVKNSNNSITVPAIVPGGIYTDLRRNNILKQDILYGRNDVGYRWVGNENWTYFTTFSIDHNIALSSSVKLVLHGIDTVSIVSLNGQVVGSTDNMFVRFKFDIKPHLKLAGVPNVLSIKFESPIKYSARKSHQSIRLNRGKIIPPYCPTPAQRGECHINFMRKMQSSFGWDWGPAYPSVGIYKDLSVEFGEFGLIRDVLVETKRVDSLGVQHNSLPQPPSIIISSSIRHQVRTPTVNTTVPYIRAPPYYVSVDAEKQHQLLLKQAQPTHPDEHVYSAGGSNIDMLADPDQLLLDETWLLKITLVVEMVQPNTPYDLRIEFNLHDTLHYESEHRQVVSNHDGFIRLGFNLRIDSSRIRIQPWWPNNAGTQTLYRLGVRMMPVRSTLVPDKIRLYPAPNAALDTVDSRTHRQKRQILTLKLKDPFSDLGSGARISEKSVSFGFRTIELIQEPVSKNSLNTGLTFGFRINGVELFAMGSNWIPSSVLPEYQNDIEYIKYLLQSAKDANMNILRVWGGGLYESDEFYSLADELGIMIWHDFMFACALYPTDDDFLNSVRLEVEQQVQRLQHHPSIVLWAGNNENEMAISGTWWPEVPLWTKRLKEMYVKLYVETIKPIVQILDPTRPFVESSPSNGLVTDSQPYSISRIPNDKKFGDVHHYDYISDSFDWTVYPSTRFASEYGFQSYPTFSTIAAVTLPSDWKYPLTSNMLHRQHRLTGEAEIKHQIKMHFNDLETGGVDKFKAFIYVSQLTQAIAIKTETEFYRRNRFVTDDGLGKTMGAMYWQLNDVWAAPTWSSIEYGGKWKTLHYFARRFFFPIQVVPFIIQPAPSVESLVASLSNANHSIGGASNGSPTLPALFAVDLIRDDLFYKLNSFNITIKLFRWTSFTPIWQDSVYILNTRPPNVTRIYEQELAKIMRQSGSSFSMSSGVFQVVIEQQARLGLSQIDNYLMPVYPNKVTAMRVATISVELVQGPFQLAEVGSGGSSATLPMQWDCGFRITLVSDSIAMFVWLDLNLLSVSQRDKLQKPVQSEHSDARRPIVELTQNRRHITNDKRDRQPSNPPFDPNFEEEAARLVVRIARDSHPTNESLNATVPTTASLKRKPFADFRPLDGTGSDMLRFQFSDNAFNMFEPTKVIDLYLTQCLSKPQVEAALEIQSLADSL